MDAGYQGLLQQLKQKIRQARQQVVLTVNKQLLAIYWEIGQAILIQQQKKGWGAKIIPQLAADLKTEFPELKGFSARNIKYMRAFAEAYPNFISVQPLVEQSETADNQEFEFVQPLVAQIPWAHHLVILGKLKSTEDRLFYLHKTVQNNWSKSVLQHQIASGLHKRQGAALNNFEGTLPAPEADLTRETFKNPYLLDFIGIGEEMQEREVEKAMIIHLRRFMLELGKGFAYVGNQYNLVVDDNDFFLDLLFYNFHLRCFVIFELKVGDFKPEFAGKLNFYINVVNDKIKRSDHKPTIGVLLCKTPNESVVKFSLQGIHTPMGIAEYEFTKALPENLQSSLPTIEALEEELEKEIILVKSPLQEKADKLKELLSQSDKEAIQREKNADDIAYLFTGLLPALQSEIKKNLEFLLPEFSKVTFSIKINDWVSPYLMEADIDGQKILKGDIELLGFLLQMDGFKKAGVNAFDMSKEVTLLLYRFKYGVGINPSRMLFDKLYHQRWNEEEIKTFAEEWCRELVEDITEMFSRV